MRLIFKMLIVIGVVILLLIMTVVGFIFWFAHSLEESSCDKYFEVPINITVEGSNFILTSLDSYSGQPDVFIYSYTETENIPQNCSIDSFHFSVGDSKIWSEIGELQGGRINSVQIRAKYSTTQSKIFKPKIYEPNNKQGVIRKAILLSNKEFQFQAELSPFDEIKTVYYRDYDSLGCFTTIFPEEININLKGIEEKEIILNPKQIICVKKAKREVGEVNDRTSNGCSFFEANSVIKIKADILENLAVEGKYCRPIL